MLKRVLDIVYLWHQVCQLVKLGIELTLLRAKDCGKGVFFVAHFLVFFSLNLVVVNAQFSVDVPSVPVVALWQMDSFYCMNSH